MIANADITLYNRKYDKVTRLDVWQRTVFKDVWLYCDRKITIGDKGVNGADVYKIRIPASPERESTYLPEDEFAQIADASNCWTLQDGDLVVKGVCDIEIDKPADLTNSRKQYCKITSWSDNRFGNLPHWRIGGE